MSESLFSIDAALAHLRRADPVLAGVIDEIGPFDWLQRSHPYLALGRAILFPQPAGPAADAVTRPFFVFYSDGEAPPAPARLLETTDEQFRSTGVSRQKAGYLRDLALHVAEGRLDFAALLSLSDDEVAQRIMAVRGAGARAAPMT